MTALAIAERFLRKELADGPRHGAELVELARARGISPSTLTAARKSLGVVSQRESWGAQHSGEGRWTWDYAPDVRRAAARERLRDHLAEILEDRDHTLDAATRTHLKALADQLAREGLEQVATSQRERVCPSCRRTFTPRRERGQRFCSRACSAAAAYRRAREDKGAA
jgi:hypothetical protein